MACGLRGCCAEVTALFLLERGRHRPPYPSLRSSTSCRAPLGDVSNINAARSAQQQQQQAGKVRCVPSHVTAGQSTAVRVRAPLCADQRCAHCACGARGEGARGVPRLLSRRRVPVFDF